MSIRLPIASAHCRLPTGDCRLHLCNPRSAICSRRAFTLFELIISLCLVVLLAGLAALSLVSHKRIQEFSMEGERFATMLRMARAEASARSRQMQLSFDENGGICLQIQADPLNAPQQFEACSAMWIGQVPTKLRCLRSVQIGADAWRSVIYQQMNLENFNAQAPQVINFYADGSCDSAVFELADVENDDDRRLVVKLDGVCGKVSVHETTSSRVDDYIEQLRQDDSAQTN